MSFLTISSLRVQSGQLTWACIPIVSYSSRILLRIYRFTEMFAFCSLSSSPKRQTLSLGPLTIQYPGTWCSWCSSVTKFSLCIFNKNWYNILFFLCFKCISLKYLVIQTSSYMLYLRNFAKFLKDNEIAAKSISRLWVAIVEERKIF